MMLNRPKWCLSCCFFFLWDHTAWIKPFLPQHEQRRASATSHCNLNWSLGKHHIVAHKLDNQWEIAVIFFAPAMSVNAGVQDPEERDEPVKGVAHRTSSATSRTTQGIAHGAAHQTRTIYSNKLPEVCCNGCVLVNSVGCNGRQWM